jgi:hypothetical protein
MEKIKLSSQNTSKLCELPDLQKQFPHFSFFVGAVLTFPNRDP